MNDLSQVDMRRCAFCEQAIGLRGHTVRAGFIYHDECAEKLCHLCHELINDGTELDDPSREPYCLKGVGDKAHRSCCQEAAWQASREGDHDDYNRATGRLAGGSGV